MSNIPPNPQFPEGAAGRPAPVSSDQLLPPVEPPSAGFLLQLFVVPAVIVAGVVLVWFIIESLARGGEQDPDAIMKALRGANGFQQAKDLADMLRTPERYALHKNRDLAQKLAAYLDELVKQADDAEGAVTMRFYLASALGLFHVDDGLATLLNTAQNDPERDVRRRALNGLAARAGRLAALDPPQYIGNEEVVNALADLARDEDELVRSEAAFAIGIVATAPDVDSRLPEALVELADDPYTDARFNAALPLARLGHPRAPHAVAEMLDFEAIDASLTGEKAITEDQSDVSLRGQRARKRDSILHNAFTAIDALVEKADTAGSLAPLDEALTKFLAAAPKVQDPAPVPAEVTNAAKNAQKRVQATL
jgi:HEAT repeat protein